MVSVQKHDKAKNQLGSNWGIELPSSRVTRKSSGSTRTNNQGLSGPLLQITELKIFGQIQLGDRLSRTHLREL